MAAEEWRNKPTAKIYAQQLLGTPTITGAAESLDIPKSTFLDRVKILKKRYPTIFEPGVSVEFDDLRKAKKQTYIITNAQNSTRMHRPFWNNLKAYAQARDAKIIIIQTRYNKNNIGFDTKPGSKSPSHVDEWWEEDLVPHFNNSRIQIADNLVICGEMQISPSAARPLSGMESYAKGKSAIYGHSKIAMVSIATSPKVGTTQYLYTTGAVTQRNYTQTKTGLKGEFHHVYGALIVEVAPDNNEWYVRQLNAEDVSGSFYDLDYKVSNGRAKTKDDTVFALNLGDLHANRVDENSAEALATVIQDLNPQNIFLHDAFDGQSVNPHYIKNPLQKVAYQLTEKEPEWPSGSYVMNELDVFMNVINDIRDVLKSNKSKNQKIYIVASNHDEWLHRWLASHDWKSDPHSARMYLRLAEEFVNHCEQYGSDNKFIALEQAVKIASTLFGEDNPIWQDNPKIEWLTRHDSVKMNGIEFALHGDLGINGSRGSILGFTKTGLKCNLGHSHASGIADGIYQAGVVGGSDTDMGYNRGLATHSRSHILTYANGKRAILTENTLGRVKL